MSPRAHRGIKAQAKYPVITVSPNENGAAAIDDTTTLVLRCSWKGTHVDHVDFDLQYTHCISLLRRLCENLKWIFQREGEKRFPPLEPVSFGASALHRIGQILSS